MRLGLFSAHEGTANAWLKAVGDSNALPVVFGLATFASAATGLFPVGPLLVAATVIAPRRWLALVTLGALGSALGAALLSFAVHALGNTAVHGLFPGIEAHPDWGRFSVWIQRYGLFALALFAALPVPQMPVLVLSTLNHASPMGIVIAVLAGKLVKYSAYAIAVRVGLLALAQHAASDAASAAPGTGKVASVLPERSKE